MAKRIAILIFDAFSLVEVSSVAEIFRLADELEIEHEHDAATRSLAPPPALYPVESEPQLSEDLYERYASDERHEPYEPYTLAIVSEMGGSIASSGAMRVWSERLGDYTSQGFDVLFITGGLGATRAKEDDAFLRDLRAVLQHSRVVKPIGEGFAVLAAANAAAQRFEKRIEPGMPIALCVAARTAPLVEQPVALDDPLGPIAAALSVIKRDRGADAAHEISERSMPGAWRRLGAVLGELDEGGAREKINAAARWIRENYGRPISVAKAAQVAAMSERSFLRRFKSQMGLTPSEYLLRARLDASCLLLVATDLPVDKIARRCGVSSGDGLAKIFRKRLALSPTEYRVTERRRANPR
jgi:transcriptional regulator GlxA family with amidase domain